MLPANQIKWWTGGNNKQRTHLNDMVRAINGLVDEVAKLQAELASKNNPLTCIVADNENEKQLRILIKDAHILGEVGATPPATVNVYYCSNCYCDCSSGHGSI